MSRFYPKWTDAVTGIRQGFFEISSNLRRSILSITSIALGIGSVMLINSLTRGSKDHALQRIERMGGTDVMTIETVPARSLDQKILFTRSPGLRYRQLLDITRKNSSVDYPLPQLWLKSGTVSTANAARETNALSVTWDYFPHFNLAVNANLGLESAVGEWNRGAGICLLGEDLALELLGNRKINPQTLRFGDLRLQVVGVVSGCEPRDWRRKAIFIPWKFYLAKIAGPESRLDRMMLKIRDPSRMETVAREVESSLLQAHRGVRDFSISTPEEEIAAKTKASRILSLVGNFIASLCLAVGGIGILNLMWSTVNNRMREIGIRKAIGATSRNVFFQFLTESATISSIGTALGLTFGTLPALLPPGVLPISPRQTPLDFLVCGVVGNAIGLLAGLYPALLASNSSPVESLSHV